jgi:hypothetical protein
MCKNLFFRLLWSLSVNCPFCVCLRLSYSCSSLREKLLHSVAAALVCFSILGFRVDCQLSPESQDPAVVFVAWLVERLSSPGIQVDRHLSVTKPSMCLSLSMSLSFLHTGSGAVQSIFVLVFLVVIVCHYWCV